MYMYIDTFRQGVNVELRILILYISKRLAWLGLLRCEVRRNLLNNNNNVKTLRTKESYVCVHIKAPPQGFFFFFFFVVVVVVNILETRVRGFLLAAETRGLIFFFFSFFFICFFFG